MFNQDITELSIAQELEGVSKHRIYVLDESAFSVVHKPEVAYWIGFLMADGCISTSNSIYLCLAIKDMDHLRKYRKFLMTDKPISTYENKKQNTASCTLVVTSKRMVTDLRRYGVVNRKRGKEQIKNIPAEYVRDFILGFFDGDGCIYRGKRSDQLNFSIASSSMVILKQIRSILINYCDLGTALSRKKENEFHHISRRKDGVNILAYGGNNQVGRIYEYLYEDGLNSIDCLIRKKDRFLK